ncbi:MAG TPA: hypothetical protein VIC57_02530, partial [Candidatus Dormibacteraeota bacterium]
MTSPWRALLLAAVALACGLALWTLLPAIVLIDGVPVLPRTVVCGYPDPASDARDLILLGYQPA